MENNIFLKNESRMKELIIKQILNIILWDTKNSFPLKKIKNPQNLFSKKKRRKL